MRHMIDCTHTSCKQNASHLTRLPGHSRKRNAELPNTPAMHVIGVCQAWMAAQQYLLQSSTPQRMQPHAMTDQEHSEEQRTRRMPSSQSSVTDSVGNQPQSCSARLRMIMLVPAHKHQSQCRSMQRPQLGSLGDVHAQAARTAKEMQTGSG